MPPNTRLQTPVNQHSRFLAWPVQRSISKRLRIGPTTNIKTINRTKNMNPCARDSSQRFDPARPRSVLVADDDVVIRELISTALASAGFDVNATCDGQQAWEALLQEHYDLLITDNEMPRLAGIELIERIHDAGMSLPVIIASGSFPMEKVRDHPELHIAAVLPKPFRILELLNAARHVFRTSRGNTTLDRRTPVRRRTNPQPIRKCNKSNPVLCKP